MNEQASLHACLIKFQINNQDATGTKFIDDWGFNSNMNAFNENTEVYRSEHGKGTVIGMVRVAPGNDND